MIIKTPTKKLPFDTRKDCIRHAILQLTNLGGAVKVETASELVMAKQVCGKLNLRYAQRKLKTGGWLLFIKTDDDISRPS